MTSCKWDRDAEQYLTDDGEPCKRDEHGDPTKHCTARRTCSQHIGRDELTCARCVGRTRQDARTIRELSALLPTAAMSDGVNSEAANLAGPAADYRVFSARRQIDKDWIYANIQQSARDWCIDDKCPQRHFKTSKGNRWHKRGLENALADLVADDDEWHPYSVLTRWHLMLAEDYGHPLPEVLSVGAAVEYLDRHLGRVAQDPGQDFPLLARELRKCRQHLESVLHNDTRQERGAPCPDCAQEEKFVRLQREYAHWCEDEDCAKFHFATDEHDRWVCPRNRKEHVWSEGDYRKWVEERTAKHAG